MTLRSLVASALSLCAAPALYAQLDRPQVGVVRYPDNSLRNISGLADDFVVNPQVLGSSDSVSFSNSGGLLSNNGLIELVKSGFTPVANYNANEPAPLLNIDGDLQTAIAWLPIHHALVHWTGKTFAVTAVNASLPGVVTALHLENASAAKLLLAEPGGAASAALISLETGNLISLNLLSGVTGPAFEQQSFVISHDERGLLIVSANGTLRSIGLPANATAQPLTIERMSSDWLHISSTATKQDWILHLTSNVAQLSALPAAPASNTAMNRDGAQ